MPRKPQPVPRRQANLQAQEMRQGIQRLRMRITELRAADTNRVSDLGDATMSALEQKVVSTLSDIFGADTVEFEQFGGIRLYAGIGVIFSQGPSIHEIRQGYRDGIAQCISSLETIVSLFEEKLGAGDPDSAARARRQFADLDLHPEIARAAQKLFKDGHYANAIEDACKALDGLVRMRSGRFDLTGTELMQNVFSPNSPTLRFNALASESDKSEQRGRMFLFSGAMLAVRNPRAHGLIEDDAVNALDYIAFLSLLAKMVDKAERV